MTMETDYKAALTNVYKFFEHEGRFGLRLALHRVRDRFIEATKVPTGSAGVFIAKLLRADGDRADINPRCGTGKVSVYNNR